jgi:hypothetical protein
MPKVGKKIKVGDEYFLVRRQNPLQESIVVSNEKGEDGLLEKEEWQSSELLKTERPVRKEKKGKE